MPELRLPSSLGYQCRAAECGRSYSREEALVSDQRPPLCPDCGSFLERVWVESHGRTALGAAGGAALGLAIAGPVGLVAGGFLGGLAASRSEGLRQSMGAIGTDSQTKVSAFISFAAEDERYRDFFVGQGRHSDTPWEIIDWSAHEPFSERWKTQMRPRIHRAKVVIMLIGTETHQAEGAIWEVEAGLEEGLPAFGVQIHKEKTPTIPSCLKPEHVIPWTWDGVGAMIRKAAALSN